MFKREPGYYIAESPLSPRQIKLGQQAEEHGNIQASTLVAIPKINWWVEVKENGDVYIAEREISMDGSCWNTPSPEDWRKATQKQIELLNCLIVTKTI